nr:LysR family transcriptional regulator [Kiloniellales bacterium]
DATVGERRGRGKNAYRGYTQIMQDGQKRDPLANWDDFRIFLAVAEAGSFSGAAKRLRTTQPTISRRIESLERYLGTRVFDRLPTGVAVTAEAKTVLEMARQFEDALIETQRRVLGADQRLEGTVRISLSEGLATFWISPRLGQFQEAYPAISLDLHCSIKPADVLNLESDLSIRFRQPQESDLIALKLGSLHAVPWASIGYLDRFGVPATPGELLHHRLLDHEYYHYLEPDCEPWVTLLRKAQHRRYLTNSSTSLMSATQNSAGVALLPTYFCEFAEGIVPLNLGLNTRSDIWLTYHPNVKKSARVRAAIDWVKSLFDHEAWPWFRDEFHPPKTSMRAQGKRPAASGVLPDPGLNGHFVHTSEEANQG